jgi:lysophospholipase L1-like esterase
VSTEPSFSRRKSLAFSVVIVSVLLGGVELSLRLVGLEKPVRPGLLLEMLDVDVSFPFMRADRETFWSPRPGWEGKFLGHRVSINEAGLRGSPLSEPRAGRTRRLLCYGDSITFGYGVGDADTYARRLDDSTRDRGLEVANAGVTGFTTYQVLRWLERTLEVARPDYATFCIGWNDGTLRPTTDREYADRLRMVMRVRSITDHLYIYRFLGGLYARAAVEAQRGTAWTTPRVPPEQYRENLGRIAAVCRSRGVKAAFVDLPRRKLPGEVSRESPYPGILREAAAEHGVPLLRVGDLAFETELETNEHLFIDSLHFSPGGHASMAAEIAQQLEALDWM